LSTLKSFETLKPARQTVCSLTSIYEWLELRSISDHNLQPCCGIVQLLSFLQDSIKTCAHKF